MFQAESEDSFWSWISEKISSHPKLSKRVSQFKGEEFAVINNQKKEFAETTDHTNYLPKN